MAMIPVVIGTESFQEKVLAIPGEELGWTAVLRVAYGDPDQLERVAKLMQWKRNLPEEDIHFIPPTTHNGKTQGAVLVSQGVVIQRRGRACGRHDGEVNKEIHPSENDKVIEPPREAAERDEEINKEIHPSKNDKVIEPPREPVERDREINKEIHPSENDKVVESPDEVM